MAAVKNAALRNKMADDFAALWNSGTVIVRESTTTLVTFSLSADAFGDAATGKISASDTPISATASASGTADNAQLISSGSTYTLTGLTVATSAANVIIDNTSINSGQTVNLTQLDWTEAEGIA